MHLNYKDFYPEITKSGFFTTEHQTLADTVARASEWAESSGAKVINVETVVLPNVHNEEEASQVGIRTSGDVASRWYQVVRVWYSVPTARAKETGKTEVW